METTADLAFYARQPRREVRGITAVANDHLCIVHEDRLIAVEDENDFLVQANEALREQVARLRRRLARAERVNDILVVRNTELHFINSKLQQQKKAMRDALLEVKRAHVVFEEAAGENLKPLFASVVSDEEISSERSGHGMTHGDQEYDETTGESRDEFETSDDCSLFQ